MSSKITTILIKYCSTTIHKFAYAIDEKLKIWYNIKNYIILEGSFL